MSSAERAIDFNGGIQTTGTVQVNGESHHHQWSHGHVIIAYITTRLHCILPLYISGLLFYIIPNQEQCTKTTIPLKQTGPIAPPLLAPALLPVLHTLL